MNKTKTGVTFFSLGLVLVLALIIGTVFPESRIYIIGGLIIGAVVGAGSYITMSDKFGL